MPKTNLNKKLLMTTLSGMLLLSMQAQADSIALAPVSGSGEVPMRRATETCLAQGSKEYGVKSLLRRLGQQVYRAPFENAGRGTVTFSKHEVVGAGTSTTDHITYRDDGTLDLALVVAESRVRKPITYYPDAHSISVGGGMRKQINGEPVHSFNFEESMLLASFSPVDQDLKEQQIDLYGIKTSPIKAGFHFASADKKVESGSSCTFYTPGCGQDIESWVDSKIDYHLVLPEGIELPKLVGGKVIVSHDDFMNPIHTREISIEMKGRGKVALINTLSGLETPLMVDLDQYATCLKNEVRRNAD